LFPAARDGQLRRRVRRASGHRQPDPAAAAGDRRLGLLPPACLSGQPAVTVAGTTGCRRRMRSPNIRYFPAIDHLRAYAAVLIVLYHGLLLLSYQARFLAPFGIDHWLPPGKLQLAPLAEGHTAVSLFMVLSGFILTYGSLDDAVASR